MLENIFWVEAVISLGVTMILGVICVIALFKITFFDE